MQKKEVTTLADRAKNVLKNIKRKTSTLELLIDHIVNRNY